MTEEFPHQKKAKEWMAFDPLDTAYQIAEERGIDTEEEQAAIGGLGSVLMRHAEEQKKMYLSEMGDTYGYMPWQDAVEIIQQQGFRITDVFDKTTEYGTYRYLNAETPDKKIALTANATQQRATKEWLLGHNIEIRAVVDTHGDHAAWRELVRGASSHPLGDLDDTDDWRFAMSWCVTDGLAMTMETLRKSTAEFLELSDDDEIFKDL